MIGSSTGNLGISMRNNLKTADCCVSTGNFIFKAHSVILQTASPIFECFLEDSVENPPEIVIDDNFDEIIVDLGLSLCYEIDIFDQLDVLTALKLLQFAKTYNLKQFNRVEKFLVENLTPNNVCQVANAALEMNAEFLLEKCVDFLIPHYRHLGALNDFVNLDSEIVKKIVQLCVFKV
uniref:BTB domain-containing protein n=1 Tax=Panagrolaimus sp. JU765 TaxID=591449 RepID=A0AC34Q1B1_9BILA